MATIAPPSDFAPTRLDVFLSSNVERLSRRTAQQLIESGAVRVNGRRAGKSQPIAAGDVVEVDDGALERPPPAPNAALDVAWVFEDSSVIALDKPAGIATHQREGDAPETLANFLAARFPECLAAAAEPGEAGIVHRLDNDTSGLLLAARTPAAYTDLRRQFTERSVVKEYQALVHGVVREPGQVRLPIAHDRRRPQRMRTTEASAPGARRAETNYRPIQHWRHHSLLAVRIRTGVRHQVRVHLAAVGHPLVGDRLYGIGSAVPDVAVRHLLHACYLEFAHPERGVRIELRSGLPADFLAALRRVQGYRERRR